MGTSNIFLLESLYGMKNVAWIPSGAAPWPLDEIQRLSLLCFFFLF